MATTPDSIHDIAQPWAPPTAPAGRKKPKARSAAWVWMLPLGLVFVGGVAAVAVYLQSSGASVDDQHIMTQKVQRGELIVTVIEDGNLESAANIDVKCHVQGGSTILWIVADGSEAKKGDLLVKLDSSLLEEQINQQRIVFERANATRIQAEKDYNGACIAVKEYLEGTYRKDMQLIEAQMSVALENLRGAENTLQHTSRLARKGYVTPLQLDAQRFAVEKSKLDLQTAELAKNVLEKFTKPKMQGDLEALRDTTEARMRSEQAACDLEGVRLKRLQTALDNCQIAAPQDGMVVYANESSSGYRSSSSGVKIEEGASVRDQQTILRVPDLSQMQCRVLVHESRIESITPGMRAHLKIQDRVFQGEVISIANQPEPTSFMSANVKEYATYVRIEGETNGKLRPGMTAEVEILIADLKDILTVPVQSVVEKNRTFHAWVRKPSGAIERRPVIVGVTNNKMIEVKDGLVEAEDVVLNPRAVIADAREDVLKSGQDDVKSKFGQSQRKDDGASNGGAPRGEGPGPGANHAAAGGAGRSGGGVDIMRADANGDGKVSLEEAPERMKAFFDTIDSNKDGFIDAGEAARARANRAKQGGAQGGSGGQGDPAGQGGPGGGQGRGPGGQGGRPDFSSLDSVPATTNPAATKPATAEPAVTATASAPTVLPANSPPPAAAAGR
ncbi:MAG: HlyD family efflux transporter periplasmic adaptor subunit [Planctomycetes bacterium]|nr:HlyD family efflux transporter periplasmic adaptor subunit [Planctomycetota bacterium]